MMRHSFRRIHVASALTLLTAAPLLGSVAPPPDAQSTVDQPPAAKGPIQPEDYGKWESLGQMSLSPDGKWLAYTIRRVDGNGDLCLRVLATDSTETIEHGSSAQFSNDSNWIAYRIGVSAEEREKLQKAGRPIPNKTALRNLVTGETDEFENIRSVSYSEDSRFAVLQMEGAIILHDLHSRSNTTFGNVVQHSFNEAGDLFAMLIRTEDDLGNGVQVFQPETGVLRTLDSEKAAYRNMTWRDDSNDLAVLRATEHKDGEDATHVVLAWKDVSRSNVRTHVYDPTEDPGFPSDYRLSEIAGLRWTDDGAGLFFGLKEWETKPKSLEEKDEENKEEAESDAGPKPIAPSAEQDADRRERRGRRGRRGDGPRDGATPPPADSGAPAAPSEKPAPKPEGDGKKDDEKEKAQSLRETLDEPSNVEVWHANDIDIIPLQKRRASFERRRTMSAAWWIDADRFVQLGDDVMESVMLPDGHTVAIGMDNTPHEELKKFGPTLNDVYVIDATTGEREKVLEAVKYTLGTSPDGRYVAYVRDDHIWTYDIESKVHRNLTDDVDVAFTNQEDSSLTDEKRAHGTAGWTEDGSWMYIYDKFDIWRFRTDDSGQERLTDGAADQVRHRRVIIDREAEEFIDPDATMFVSLYGDRNKKFGYGRLIPGDGVERIMWKDKAIRRLTRAKDADVFAWREEDFNDSPDIFIADQRFESPKQVTETNAFQDEYHWGHSELVTYTNAQGKELQGALFYPAGYDPDKQYPMIVYIYEERSQVVHNYSTPTETHPYNTAVYTAQGYFVFQPDIVYRPQNPGLSAVECVVPAVETVLDTGMIDPDRVGLIGHSWGAYQTAFIVTQTDLFAAGIAGAPLTNMMSMSMSIYWNSGQTDAWIFHESQGRMDRPFWQDVETYIRNSPIFNIDAMNTPLMIAFGDDDGAVDFNQGVEMYNAARLAGKQFVMLVYPGENHSLRNEANQVDYHYRVLEWFDHYLKGGDAKSWITDGQTWLDRQKEIKEKHGDGNGGGNAGGPQRRRR